MRLPNSQSLILDSLVLYASRNGAQFTLLQVLKKESESNFRHSQRCETTKGTSECAPSWFNLLRSQASNPMIRMDAIMQVNIMRSLYASLSFCFHDKLCELVAFAAKQSDHEASEFFLSNVHRQPEIRLDSKFETSKFCLETSNCGLLVKIRRREENPPEYRQNSNAKSLPKMH